MKNRTEQKKKKLLISFWKMVPPFSTLMLPEGIQWTIERVIYSSSALWKGDHLESGCAMRWRKKDQPHVFKISSPHNLSWKYEHFKLLFCSSSFCDTWPLIPFPILILVYIPWRISRLPFTFQHVCFWLIVTWSERGQPVPFQARTPVVGTATVWSFHPFPDKVKYPLRMQIQNKIQFAANWIFCRQKHYVWHFISAWMFNFFHSRPCF